MHDLVRLLHIVSFMIKLSQRLDIKLSFLYQEPVSGFGVVFKFVYRLDDLLFQLMADPLDQLIQLNQVVVLSQFLFDLKMVRTRRPIVHFPKFFLFQLLNCDKFVFALFMVEFSQTYWTKEGTLSTLLAETYNLNFLVFVFLVHACEFALEIELWRLFHLLYLSLAFWNWIDF